MEAKKNHFQQSDFWCGFKSCHGWNVVKVDECNVLVRNFKKAFLNFSIAYAPMLPLFDEESVPAECCLSKMEELAKKAKVLLPANCICLRFDLPVEFSSVSDRDSFVKSVFDLGRKKSSRIKKSLVDIQPPDTTCIDLSRSMDEILLSMKNKWRYNIRYAEKHEVKVRKTTCMSENFLQDLKSFYSLYKVTSERDGIGLHPESYYEDLMKKSIPESEVNLYIASHQGTDLAAIITLFQKDEAIYLYGCSGNVKRNLMPAYLLQKTAVQDAKDYGCKIYDFYGIPPVADDSHPMHGLYLFKMGFGGKEIHRPGCFDYPFKMMYSVYSFLEKLRAFWHKIIIKKIRGR